MRGKDCVVRCFLICLLFGGLTASKCPPIKVHKDTIIRTKESTRKGAKMLYHTDIQSSRECYELCCETKTCNVGIVHYKKERDRETGEIITQKSCFIFACGTPNRCVFMNHTGYAVIEMRKINRNKHTGKKIHRATEKPIVEEDCPPGTPVAMCARDPCEGKTCHAHKTARCVANYCGGCHAFWYDKQANRVECHAKKTKHHKVIATTPMPTEAPTSPPEEDQEPSEEDQEPFEEDSSENVSEEEVEIRPEDTSGKPTEDPNVADGEDPHRVKEWRTWLSDEREVFTCFEQVTAHRLKQFGQGLFEDNAFMLKLTIFPFPDPQDDLDKSRKPTKIIEPVQASHVTVTLAIALGVCLFILIAVLVKLKCTGPKKKKKFAVDDGDYLINGMYL
eukprot:gene17704-19473_t